MNLRKLKERLECETVIIKDGGCKVSFDILDQIIYKRYPFIKSKLITELGGVIKYTNRTANIKYKITLDIDYGVEVYYVLEFDGMYASFQEHVINDWKTQ